MFLELTDLSDKPIYIAVGAIVHFYTVDGDNDYVPGRSHTLIVAGDGCVLRVQETPATILRSISVATGRTLRSPFSVKEF